MYKFFSLHVSKWKLILLAGDAGCFCLAALVGIFLNPKVGPDLLGFVAQHLSPFMLVGLTYLVVFYIADLYDYRQDYRRWTNVAKVTFTVWSATLVVILIFYFPLGAFIGRILLIIQTVILTFLMVGWRWTFSAIALPDRLRRRLFIIGAGKSGQAILGAIRRRPGCGLEVVGFVDDDPRKVGTVIQGLPVLGDSAGLQKLVEEHQVNLLVVAITHEKSPPLIGALTRVCWNGCQPMDMPGLYEFLASKVPIEHISDIWLYLNSLQNHRIYYRHIKRLIDVGLALLGLALSWPLFAVIALAIKINSPGPVFFRQERLGQEGRPFQILKFRTMVEDAELLGPQWARENDPRITRVGRILRKLRLDELPQLINILRGDMSFIGPRPEREIFVRQFQELVPDLRPGRRTSDPPGFTLQLGLKEKIPYYSYRLLVKPGLTGWAQVMFPYTSSLDQTREKLKYDLYYIKNMGFFLDLAIMLKTVRIVLFGRGT